MQVDHFAGGRYVNMSFMSSALILSLSKVGNSHLALETFQPENELKTYSSIGSS